MYEKDTRYRKILKHYGDFHQRKKLVEECGELLAELGRFMNGELSNIADLVHEIADVLVVVRQLSSETKRPTGLSNVDAIARLLTRDTIMLANEAMHPTRLSFNSRASANAAVANFTAHAEDFAVAIGELPMLLNTIDLKIDRQIERMARDGAPTYDMPRSPGDIEIDCEWAQAMANI